jgi:hypothetical protein
MAQPFKPYQVLLYTPEPAHDSMVGPDLDNVPADELARYSSAGFNNPRWVATALATDTTRGGFHVTWTLNPE